MRSSAIAASAARCRHRSAATSPSNWRSLASSSGAANAWPLSSACSRSTRAQKPWMVNTAARSISSTACCKRRRKAAGVSLPPVRCVTRMARVSNASGASWRSGPGRDGSSARSVAVWAAATEADVAPGSWIAGDSLAARAAPTGASGTKLAASTRRSRIRRRSSCVAASVKVTARIWPMRTPRSTTSRVNKVASVKVLPVPALASIRRTPCSGNCRYGSVTWLMLIRHLPARRANAASCRSSARHRAARRYRLVRAMRTHDGW